jgi:hypothetical protein
VNGPRESRSEKERGKVEGKKGPGDVKPGHTEIDTSPTRSGSSTICAFVCFGSGGIDRSGLVVHFDSDFDFDFGSQGV